MVPGLGRFGHKEKEYGCGYVKRGGKLKPELGCAGDKVGRDQEQY